MSELEDYRRKLKAKLEEMDAEIDKFRAKAKQQSADASIEAGRIINELRAQRDEVERRLKELRGAGSHAWTDLKSGADDAVDRMRQALKSARSHFK